MCLTLHQQLVLCQGLCRCCPISSPANGWSRPSWSPVQCVWRCINNWFYFSPLQGLGALSQLGGACTLQYLRVTCYVWLQANNSEETTTNPSQSTAPRTGHARCTLFNSLYLEKGQQQCKQQQQRHQLSQSGAWRTGHARCILFNHLYLERGTNSENNDDNKNFPKVVLEEQVMPGAVFSIACTWKGAEAIFYLSYFQLMAQICLDTVCYGPFWSMLPVSLANLKMACTM